MEHVSAEQVDDQLAAAISNLTTHLRAQASVITAPRLKEIAAQHSLFVARPRLHGTPAGMACLVTMDPPQGSRFLIESMSVLPEFSRLGLGLGSLLLRNIFEAVMAAGGKQVRLTCNEKRAGARALYEEVGFRSVSTDVMSIDL